MAERSALNQCCEAQFSTTTKEETMKKEIMKFFAYEHLPERLQTISRPFGELARSMDREVQDSDEKSAGLRKLLEAKDCFVRAYL